MKIKILYLALVVAALSSCAHSLPYQSSGIELPTFWAKITHAQKSSPVDINAVIISDDKAQVENNWWKHFDDATLDELIKEAVSNNKTLGIARARVQEALADLGYAKASQLPEIDLTANPQRGNQGLATNYKPLSLVEVNLQATWEIDIFGRNLPRLSQAKELLQNADASRQAVLVGLLAELGRNYFDLQDYREQIRITNENLKNQKKTLELTRAQLAGALASDFDVERAAAQVSTTESKLPQLKSAYDATMNRINLLVGNVPGTDDDLIQKTQFLQPLDERIVVAAPATVLANRPDVKAAERNFAASISGKKAAAKLFFPDITLLTFFGLEKTNRPVVYPWSIGLNIIEPVLDFGRIRAQINVADAQQNQAFLNYQQTVLEALGDMQNALTNYNNEIVRNGLLRSSVTQNRRAADLAEKQFKNGFIGLLDVLVAQNNVLNAESSLADSDAALRIDLVNIYTASGGSWQIE